MTAKRLQGDDGHVVAVIGDGAFTSGLAYEGMNNARSRDNLIIVLNDNEMSISKCGALAKYLAVIRSKPEYFKVKDFTESTLKKSQWWGEAAGFHLRLQIRIQTALIPQQLFEDFGYVYLGPVSSHDVDSLCEVLERANPFICRCWYIETTKGRDIPRQSAIPALSTGFLNSRSKPGNLKRRGELLLGVWQGAHLPGPGRQTHLRHHRRYAGWHWPGRLCPGVPPPDGSLTWALPNPMRSPSPAALQPTACFRCLRCTPPFYRGVMTRFSTTLPSNKNTLFWRWTGLASSGTTGRHTKGRLTSPCCHPSQDHYLLPASFRQLTRCLRSALYEDAGVVAVRYPRGGEPAFPPGYPDQGGDYSYYGGGETLIVTYGRLSAEAAQAVELLKGRGRRFPCWR